MITLLLFILILFALQTNGFDLSLSCSPQIRRKPPKTKISNTPVIICPGFGLDENDYLFPLNQPRETSLVAALERRGFEKVYIIPLKRYDWIRVIGGIFDVSQFYSGKCSPNGFGYGWYVKRLKETVNRAYKETGEKSLVIGHSAGGWLARAAMGDGVWSDNISTKDRIRCLVTLGAVHKVPIDKNRCPTRGALLKTDALYPGAFLKEDGIGYISVGGCTVKGEQNVKTGTFEMPFGKTDAMNSIGRHRLVASMAYKIYKDVAGRGNLIGDGVVPFEWTQLDGARQILLEGVVHSIHDSWMMVNPLEKWYGSETVIDSWLSAVLDEAALKR